MNTRRKFLKQVTIGSVAASFLPVVSTPFDFSEKKTGARALRIAHITDVHILDQRNAETSFERVMMEINSMKDKPDFIINTGDSVMDENKQTKETVAERWKIWNKVAAGNKIKIYSALGNHDVWYGPDEKLDAEYKSDKRYGKQWAIEMLALPNRYYSFEAKGWHFIALDSINGTSGYQLDDEQFEWLGGELAKIPSHRPICVYNHVPIISVGAMMYLTKREPALTAKFPSGDMHLDHQRIKDLFYKHKNVKMCLSGHVHYIDQVEYLGVKYLCNGAVSGNWWNSPIALDEFPPVYSIIDLYTDGTINCSSVFYSVQGS